MIARVIAGMMLFGLPCSAGAADPSGDIRFKAGEMELIAFLEMISEKLDVTIDASGLGDGSLGTIAVPEMGALNRERANALVLTSLYLEGYTWIHNTAADMYRVVRLRDARDQEIPVISDPARLPDSHELVTYIMPIRHASPEFIARNMRSFMPANSRIIPDVTTSSILITDSAHNISKLKKLVERVDTPEAAKQAEELLARKASESNESCASSSSAALGPRPTVLIALFSLIALVIGFLTRGYVIRRIEGGL
ncbi:MAG: hypothetical protein A2X94_04570 [Bdellovibrionales bacterium GWB1_55_8]|nr:MAG: hypothetical protein A2X94_04570 [Bdellovibrionales bacterium GWB1_55_8]